MSIQDQLAFSLGYKDQRPNRLLAKIITKNGGAAQLHELVDFFLSQPNKELQKDAVLTMAWVGQQSPEMLVPYVVLLIENLNSSFNGVIWGSMIALATFAHLVPDKIYEALPKIIDAMDAGTVITRDHGYRILIIIYQMKKYQEDLFFIILDQIRRAPANQLGQYTERLMPVLSSDHKEAIIGILEDRRGELTNAHHLNRLNKNILKIHQS